MDELKIALEKHIQGKLDEAELIYKKILTENSENSEALHLLGVIFCQKGNYTKAIDLINHAIKIVPNSPLYYNNLAMIYQTIDNEEESIKNFKKALELNPNYENAHLAYYNLGVYYKDNGDFGKAVNNFTQAINLKKDFYDAIWNKGLILLLRGDFKSGLQAYESRFKKIKSSDSRFFPKSQYQGQENKKVLVICEQGYGDNIQFIRYLQLIKERKCKIILECKKELINLFKDLADKIIEYDKDKVPETDYDCYIHLMSLPNIFNTTMENIPNKTPYLKAEEKLVRKFKEIIKGKFKVGICWRGNPNQENDKNRSIPFDKFKQLIQIQGISFFSLQKDKRDEQISGATDLSFYMNDFTDTAAILENLDLIISVDTSISHLAGALNKPVWTLLSKIPDWRYLLDRNDSIWYPSMRLFRQKKQSDWDSLMQEVSQELINIKNRG